jgi:hypothetical protein
VDARQASGGGKSRRLNVELAQLVIGELLVKPSLQRPVGQASNHAGWSTLGVEIDACGRAALGPVEGRRVGQGDVAVGPDQDDRDVGQVVQVGQRGELRVRPGGLVEPMRQDLGRSVRDLFRNDAEELLA